jgi:hypothetical protein
LHPYERANFRAIITVDPDDGANSVSVDTKMTFYLFNYYFENVRRQFSISFPAVAEEIK